MPFEGEAITGALARAALIIPASSDRIGRWRGRRNHQVTDNNRSLMPLPAFACTPFSSAFLLLEEDLEAASLRAE